MDVEPHVELGPIGQWKYPQAFALALAAVVEPPGLGTLAFGVPAVLRVAQREHPFLGPRALLVAPGAAEGGIEPVMIECLPQSLRLHNVGVEVGMADWTDAASNAVLVDMNDQLDPQLAGAA